MSGLRRRVRGRVAWAVLLSLLVVTITLVSAGIALADKWTDITDAQWQSKYQITADDAATVAVGQGVGLKFFPDQAVTRGQFAKMVVDGFGIAYSSPASPTFPDVLKSNIFYKYIEGGVNVGIIGGYQDGTYKPNNTVSRQQANKILGTFLSDREIAETGQITGSKGTYTSLSAWYAAEGALILAAFNDATNVAAVHAPATAYLVYREVVKGSNGNLTPGTVLKRAQAVALIIRVRDATFTSAYTADMPVSLLSPTPSAGNTISTSGTGGTRFVEVNVVNGTAQVILGGTKTASQGGTVGGTDASSVVLGGSSTSPTFTINTSSVAAGGSKTFTLNISETGKSPLVYTVTVKVASGLNLTLITPAPSATNTISTTGASTQFAVSVNVASGTSSVVLGGTKTSAQTVSVSGANSALVTAGGSVTSPTFTVNTSSIATTGGSKTFILTLSESGKQSIVYLVTVTVGPDFVLTLTSPAPATTNDNTITTTGGGAAWSVVVNVASGTQSVLLTGSKTSAQTVSVGGAGEAFVIAGGTITAPTYTVNTTAISTGGSRVFTLTLSEPGKTNVVFTVTVNVLPFTADVTLALTTPAPSTVNTITPAPYGTGGVRTVAVNVSNATASVVLTVAKTTAQTITVTGTNSASVSASASTTLPAYTVNTASIAAAGGTSQFTLTVKETGKSSVAYNVTITVGGLTTPMTLTLTTPAPSANNTIAAAGSAGTRTVAVQTVTGTATVVLGATKTATQSVTVGGTNAASVSQSAADTAATFSVDTADIAAAGGVKVFTLTLAEAGKGTIVYTVTVTVLGPYTANMILSLTNPSPGVGNSIEVTGTGETRTVAVQVANGINSVVLTGVKATSQTVAVGGTNSANVATGGTSTIPTFTVNTSSVATGGTRVFTLTVSETGKTSIVYNVTVTVGGLTDPFIDLLLFDPTPSPDNTISVTGTGATRTVAVNVVSGTNSVVLTATKLGAPSPQTVAVGGLNAGDVQQFNGGTTSPSFDVDTSGIALTGGTRVFTLTLSQSGKGSIVYNVTVTVALPFTGSISLSLFSPGGAGNSMDAITESGGTRPVQVNVQNGTASVVLHAAKTAAQTVTKGGTDASRVVASGTTTSPVYTVNTSTISTGGSLHFNLVVTEANKATVTYQVTVTVGGLTAAMTDFVLTTPSPNQSNALNVTGSLATRQVAISVQNLTSSVVFTATKSAAQAFSDLTNVAISGTATDPIFTIDTSSVAAAGGQRTATFKLTEAGKGFITYTVTVTVAGPYTANMALVLTSPTGSGNTIDVTETSASTRSVAVNVVSGVTSVLLTGTKTTTQSVVKGGADSASVTMANAGTGAGTTAPTFTINTSSISGGGARTFTLTVNETGKSSLVYTVVVTVAGSTQPMTNWDMTNPTPDSSNTIATGGSGAARTVTVNVANSTNTVVITADKFNDQTVTVGGANAGDVSSAGTLTEPTFTIDMGSLPGTVGEDGGSKVFTLTLSRAGESSIVYTVTVNVAMRPMTLELTTPTLGSLNTFDMGGSGATRTVSVHVVNGVTSVVLTGSKTAIQTLAKSGTNSADVTIANAGTTTPTFTVNTTSIAAAGGTKVFTITLTEAGKGSIAYNVTVTVAGRTDPMGLALTTPQPSGGNSIGITGTGGTRTVTVSVVNGIALVDLTGAITAQQSVLIGGVNAGDVALDETTPTAPTFSINTSTISGGGSKVFTITLTELGKGPIVYTVTVTVAGS